MPPPSWYAPYLGAKDFKKEMSKHIDSQLKAPGMGGTAGSAIGETQRHYEDGYGWSGSPGYKDYNVKNDGKGMFWAGVENPDEPDYLKRSSCTDLPFWVENGEAPPPQHEGPSHRRYSPLSPTSTCNSPAPRSPSPPRPTPR